MAEHLLDDSRSVNGDKNSVLLESSCRNDQKLSGSRIKKTISLKALYYNFNAEAMHNTQEQLSSFHSHWANVYETGSPYKWVGVHV